MPESDASLPLAGVRVVTLAVNLPGPCAAARLCSLGAEVVKVEPPAGDPLVAAAPAYYAELVAGQRVVTLDLKDEADREQLWTSLVDADLLLTSTRPSALRRLGLAWDDLHDRFPRLCQVAIVGHPGDGAETPGHDLTYQASVGTLRPPDLPTVLVADLAGAERAAADALAALVQRARTGSGQHREVALSDVADDMARPLSHGLTAPDGLLGGALPMYRIYAAATGYVAVAALEGHFWARLVEELGVDSDGRELDAVFAGRTAPAWEAWAAERDLPLAAVRAPSTL